MTNVFPIFFPNMLRTFGNFQTLSTPPRFKKRDFNQLSFQQKDKFLTKYFFTKSKTCDKTKKQKQGNSDKALPKTVGRDGSHHLDGL